MVASDGKRFFSHLKKVFETHEGDRWKQQLIKEGAEIFSRNPSHEQEKSQAVETDLFEQIGRLKMELEWLKKKVP